MPPTIFALSSAPGRAGVAVVRVSGPRGRRRASMRLAPPRPKERVAALRRIRDPADGRGARRGAGAVVRRAAHRDRRGHGRVPPARGPGHRQRRAGGARRASPGAGSPSPASSPAAPSTTASSTSPQVEGLADLIDAETEAQRRQALRQMRGALSELYEGWRARADRRPARWSRRRSISATRRTLRAMPSRRARRMVGELQRRHRRAPRRRQPRRDPARRVPRRARRAAQRRQVEPAQCARPARGRHRLGGGRHDARRHRGAPRPRRPARSSSPTRPASASRKAPIEREGIRRTLAHARDADLVAVAERCGGAARRRRRPTLRRAGTSFFCRRQQNRSSPVRRHRPGRWAYRPRPAPGCDELIRRAGGASRASGSGTS